MLQGDTFVVYQFIICLDYVLRTLTDLLKENGLTLERERSRQYQPQTITDGVYADNVALLANKPTQAVFLQHIVERVSNGIGRQKEYMILIKEVISPHKMLALRN